MEFIRMLSDTTKVAGNAQPRTVVLHAQGYYLQILPQIIQP